MLMEKYIQLIHGSIFYRKLDNKIESYDINGDLVDDKCLENILVTVDQNFLFGYFNNRFIIGTEIQKK